MTLNRLTGFAVAWDLSGGTEVAEEVKNNVTLTVGVPDVTTTFSYTLLPSPPGEIPKVDLDTNDLFTAFNEISADDIISGGETITAFVGEITWAQGSPHNF